jgi:glycosyltransferase involved in cell wall biosynthesis
MRIIQIIDSLDIGGAEKMAVSYANSLSSRMEFSGLVVTRKEGKLKKNIRTDVSYLFLNKKKTIDFKVVLKLKEYCISNRIQIIQAHSSSFFLACMVKLMLPKIAVIWHDHFGNFVPPKRKNSFFIRIFSVLFQGVIAVDFDLEAWSKKKLFCKNVIYLQNYIPENKEYSPETILHGIACKRVLCVANLRPQKNHLMLVEVVHQIHKKFPGWTYHLIGNDCNNFYSNSIKEKIKHYQLENIIFIYGAKEDIENCISQSDVGIFTSISEGLPVALLEFGKYKKPVVATSVGQIPFVIKHQESGLLSDNNSILEFSKNLSILLKDEQLRVKFGENLYDTIEDNYSESVVINKYISWISNLSKQS